MPTIEISFLNLRLNTLFIRIGNILLNPLNMAAWILGTEKVILLGYPIPSPGDSSRPRNWTRVFCTADGFSTSWAIREAWRKRGNCNYSKGAVFLSSSFLGALTRPLAAALEGQVFQQVRPDFQKPMKRIYPGFSQRSPSSTADSFLHNTPSAVGWWHISSHPSMPHFIRLWFHLCFTSIQF